MRCRMRCWDIWRCWGPIKKTPSIFRIEWQNRDGTILQVDEVEAWQLPAYTGGTPTKESTAQYNYTFNWWDKEIVPAESDEVYVAQYEQTLRQYTVNIVVENWTASAEVVVVNYWDTTSINNDVLTIWSYTIYVTPEWWYEFSSWEWVPQIITGDTIITAVCTEPTPSTCPVTLTGLPETYDVIQLATQNSIEFTTTYDCDNPDYSTLSVTSDDENVLTIDETYWEEGYINITWRNDGTAHLTFTDADGDHIVVVNVGNDFYPQDWFIELQDNETDWARWDYWFSYNPEILTITAELNGEPLDDVEISTYDGEEGDEFPYRVSVLLPYGSEVREDFDLVFNDETLWEVARWPVDVNIPMTINNPRPDLGNINWVAATGDVFVLDTISVDEAWTLKYWSEDIVSTDSLAWEIVWWMNTYPDDPSYPDVRFIPVGGYEVNQTVIPYRTLQWLEPVWEENNQYAILYPRLPNVTSWEPITLNVWQSNPVRYLYHAENAMDFSRISATVTDENIATVEVMSWQYWEWEVIIRWVSEGYTEFYLEYYDETKGISITTDIVWVNVTN